MKKESNLKKQIKELKKTPKGQAILKLIGWLIFFFVLFLFCFIASFFTKNYNKSANIPVKEEQIEEISPVLTSSMLTEIKNNLVNYSYKYEITENNIKYIFEGTKTPDTDIGFKEGPNGTIKYYIDNTGTYQETTTDRIIINNLYEGLDINYLNIDYIINELNNIELILNKNHNCNNYFYEGLLNNLRYQVELKKDTKELIFINIIKDTNIYTLTFNGGVYE